VVSSIPSPHKHHPATKKPVTKNAKAGSMKTGKAGLGEIGVLGRKRFPFNSWRLFLSPTHWFAEEAWILKQLI
jgi:hypothetical protein